MLPATHFSERFDPFDTEQTRSMINLVPKDIRAKILDIPEEKLVITERKLRAKVNPTETVELLRFSFWREYAEVQDNHLQGMRIGNIVFGICSRQYFYRDILENENALLWIIKPPLQYNVLLDQLLWQGFERLKEILDLPIVQDGKINNQTVMRITQVFEKLDNRRNGGLRNRSIVKKDSLELSEELSEEEMLEAETFDGDVHDLHEQLKELDGGIDRTEKAEVTREEETTRE